MSIQLMVAGWKPSTRGWALWSRGARLILDTDAEDHAPDELRYACMSRPGIVPAPD
ncbi:MAG: hypothetical protein JO110_21290 [Acetobacteraceae bacterium]|nr:hypothetical protein [Acetobacteraceae bacterium]